MPLSGRRSPQTDTLRAWTDSTLAPMSARDEGERHGRDSHPLSDA